MVLVGAISTADSEYDHFRLKTFWGISKLFVRERLKKGMKSTKNGQFRCHAVDD